jgi:transcription elongation GreA/GreB family factor
VEVPINQDFLRSLNKFKKIEENHQKKEEKEISRENKDNQLPKENNEAFTEEISGGIRLNKKRLRALQVDFPENKKSKKRNLGEFVSAEPEKTKKVKI